MFCIALARFCLLSGLFLATAVAHAQPDTPATTTDSRAQQLALIYYKIDFTKEQRRALSGLELEFIYQVDSLGNLTLQDVNGLHDPILLDSMRRAGPLPRIPLTEEYKKAAYSLFFLKLEYPVYESEIRGGTFQRSIYRHPQLEDFEYITLSGTRFDMHIGPMANVYAGKPASHLKPGWGFFVHLGITGSKKWGGSLNMVLTGNKVKKPFPISDARRQGPEVTMLQIGLAAHKVLAEKEKNFWQLQGDLNLTTQNIVYAKENEAEEGVQFTGFSPGIVLSHHVQFSKRSPMLMYGEPTLLAHYVVFRGAVRYLFQNHPNASGPMFELGVGYSMNTFGIKEYKLK